jgi:hypothetical protein
MCNLHKFPVDRCWFCVGWLLPGQYINKHHPVADRYFRSQEISREVEITVEVHAFCHALWHLRHDCPNADWIDFRQLMRDLHYGYGIFSQANWLRKGTLPEPLSEFWRPYHPRAAQAALNSLLNIHNTCIM